MHHTHSHRPSPLEIKQLAEFDASLGDMPEGEKRQKRIAYLKDAARQMQAGASMMKGFGCLMIPFIIIPIFWPFVAFFWFMRKKAFALMDAQLAGALDYWGIRRDEIMPREPGTRRREAL